MHCFFCCVHSRVLVLYSCHHRLLLKGECRQILFQFDTSLQAVFCGILPRLGSINKLKLIRRIQIAECPNKKEMQTGCMRAAVVCRGLLNYLSSVRVYRSIPGLFHVRGRTHKQHFDVLYSGDRNHSRLR